jgi:ADP-ribose pyrophosphatase YjhB (NUDIX family)
MVTCLVSWPTGPVRLEWSTELSIDLPVTGAHGFCFLENSVVVCDIEGRGLTIPGGHMEPGESPDACFAREAMEEAAVEFGNVSLLGYVIADHTVNATYAGRYPRRAAQAMFAATVHRLGEFRPATESTERCLVPAAALPSLHHEWNVVLGAAYALALARVQSGALADRWK